MDTLRYAVRMLLRRRGFSAAAMITLALGIGANTAVFSLVDAVLLRPLPYRTAERLVQIEERHASGNAANLTYATFLDLEAGTRTLEHLSAFRQWQFNVIGRGEPQRVAGARVSSAFFTTLGAAPIVGRAFLPSDDRSASSDVVVLSYGAWQRWFGGLDVVGRSLELNTRLYIIVGVMPAGFDFPTGAELWVPLAARGTELESNRRAHLLTTIACLRPRETIEAARTDLAQVARNLVRANPGPDDDMTLGARTLQDRLTGPVRPTLMLILAVVACVLLIAMVNVAHLLLARVLDRRRELAVRSALGAPRRRLVMLVLAENLTLAAVGGLLGVALAGFGVRAIVKLGATDLVGSAPAVIDWRVVGFAILLTLAVGLVSGLPPSLHIAAVAPADTFRQGARGIHSVPGGRLMRFLVVVETAVSLVLVSATALLIASLVRLARIDAGFNADRVLTLDVFVGGEGEPNPDRIEQLFGPALERVRGLPGVIAASLVNVLPTDGAPSTDFIIDRHPELGDRPTADIAIVDAEYFRTLTIPLLKGRLLEERDARGRTRAVVVSQALAQRYFGSEDPIGQHIVMLDWGPPLSAEIVGIVGDVHDRGLAADAPPMIYWSYRQFPSSFNTVVVKTSGDPIRQASAIKAAIWAVDPRQPVSSVKRLDDLLAASLARRRLSLWLVALFAALAMTLSAIGVYGVLSYAVERRAPELAVRLALGAQPRGIFGLVMADGLRLAGWGIAVGLVGAIAAGQLVRSLLYGTSATDPLALGGATLVALSAAALACAIPAGRAMQIDLIDSIRD